MAIAHVQSGGTLTPNATSGSRTTGSNVTAGNRVIVTVKVFTTTNNDPFVVGDLTKTGGTSTIGSITLDAEENVDYEGGTYLAVGIWSFLVTGTGSLTVTASGATGYYWGVSVAEFSGNWDSSFLEDTAINSTSSNNTNADTGNADSAGVGLFMAEMVTSNNGGTVTIAEDGNFTLILENQDDDANICGSSIYRISSGALTDSGSWTIGSNLGWAAALAVYKEGTAAGIRPDYSLFPKYKLRPVTA